MESFYFKVGGQVRVGFSPCCDILKPDNIKKLVPVGLKFWIVESSTIPADIDAWVIDEELPESGIGTNTDPEPVDPE